MRRVILFDIDHTIFNTSEYVSQIEKIIFQNISGRTEGFEERAKIIWSQQHKRFGYFEPSLYVALMFDSFSFTKTQEEIVSLISDEKLLASCLYQEVEASLGILLKKGFILGVFSSGDPKFQKDKVAAIEHLFSWEHGHIFVKKTEELENVFEKYRNANVFVVDDLMGILHKLKNYDSDIKTIWMRRGKWFGNQEKPEGFRADFEVDDLRGVVQILYK